MPFVARTLSLYHLVSHNAKTLSSFPPLQLMAHPNVSLQVPLSATDIVLSCAICQATLSTIYRTGDEVHGLTTGDESQGTTVIKFWLTECAHLICSKHFEGGGICSCVSLNLQSCR